MHGAVAVQGDCEAVYHSISTPPTGAANVNMAQQPFIYNKKNNIEQQHSAFWFI